MAESIANPILTSPYDPTGAPLRGRSPRTDWRNQGGSSAKRVVHSHRPPARKGKKVAASGTEEAMDFDLTGERREKNSLINQLRGDVDHWRQRSYHGTTAITRKLLEHWADPHRENRVLFCQRKAAETAIFLAEVAGRHGYQDWRRQIQDQNAAHNAGLPRVALKMATGSGKTVVMAMLIAWQTLNKVQSPRDARFPKRFFVVTPGITTRDRLRVLFSGDEGNCYDQRDLIPPDLKGALNQAQIIITNYHSFQPRDVKEIKGVSANTTITDPLANIITSNWDRQDNLRSRDDAMGDLTTNSYGSGTHINNLLSQVISPAGTTGGRPLRRQRVRHGRVYVEGKLAWSSTTMSADVIALTQKPVVTDISTEPDVARSVLL
jgi:type III restriction enzyme